MRYGAAVVDHFERPRYCGRLPANPARVVSGAAGRIETGARVAIDLAIDAGSDGAVVADVRWRVFGCPHLVAAASLMAEGLPGMCVARLGELRAVSMAEQLELPTEKLGRMLVLEDALQAAAKAAELLAGNC